MLVLNRKIGEQVRIFKRLADPSQDIFLKQLPGGRWGITAPPGVRIVRQELLDREDETRVVRQLRESA
jgi:sRNA-binding carbon storage regulator CsrA